MSVPQIIVNQEGADLINKLLDVALKGGGLAALALVKDVITIVNTPPPQPKQPEAASKGVLDDEKKEQKIISINPKKEK